MRPGEGPNAFSSTLSDYRAQISTTCLSRPWTILIDGTKILTTADIVSGVHPTTAGHIKYANFVAPYVAIGGGFSSSLSAYSAIFGQPVTVTLTRALSSTFISGDSITVNWGDGSTSTLNPIVGNTSMTATHSYSSAGNYSISFTNNQNWSNPSSVSYASIPYGSGSLVSYTPPISPESIAPSAVTPSIITLSSSFASAFVDNPTPLLNQESMPILPISSYDFGTTTLRLSSKGSAVVELQKFLDNSLKISLKEDGILGPKTIQAIKTYQQNHRLEADGIVGEKTKAEMNLR